MGDPQAYFLSAYWLAYGRVSQTERVWVDDEGLAILSLLKIQSGSYGNIGDSSHLNVSRAREFYIGWNSCYISSTHPAELVFCASAINFLLISDGSAVLRYST